MILKSVRQPWSLSTESQQGFVRGLQALEEDRKLTVIASFSCQLEYIRNQLKHEVLGAPMRDFLFFFSKTGLLCVALAILELVL